jgi:hypothetical protein
MTFDTLKKANEISDAIDAMGQMHSMLEDGECIRLKRSDGFIAITTDAVLIEAIKCQISRRIVELKEELERL